MTKQLFRSKINRKVSGVCGGIAEYFDIDPVIIRVIFVVTTLCWGFGLLIYIILWIVVPSAPMNIESVYEKKTQDTQEKRFENTSSSENRSHKGRTIGGILLILLGVLILMDNISAFLSFSTYWPVLLIVIGILILLLNFKKKEGLKNEN